MKYIITDKGKEALEEFKKTPPLDVQYILQAVADGTLDKDELHRIGLRTIYVQDLVKMGYLTEVPE